MAKKAKKRTSKKRPAAHHPHHERAKARIARLDVRRAKLEHAAKKIRAQLDVVGHELAAARARLHV